MDSAYPFADALWVSALASVLAVLVRWNDFIIYFNELYFFAIGVMFVVLVFSVLYGLLIVLSLYRLLIGPYADESWGLNAFFFLFLSVAALVFGIVTYVVGTTPAPVLAFGSAGAFSAGLSLLIWASYSYAGQTWKTIPPPPCPTTRL